VRYFTATFEFQPDSCKHLPVVLEVGERYKVLTNTKRKNSGIWILVKVNGTKYDVFLTDTEMELGIIEKIKKRGG
jgi:hypothetical protein